MDSSVAQWAVSWAVLKADSRADLRGRLRAVNSGRQLADWSVRSLVDPMAAMRADQMGPAMDGKKAEIAVDLWVDPSASQ